MPEIGLSCVTCRTPLADARLTACPSCGATFEDATDQFASRVQRVLGDELVLLQVIGRGGMAVVYAAHDPALHRLVAAKAMLPETLADAELAERFRREVLIAAQLEHPHIVGVHGVRQRDGLLVMLMEMVEGRSLETTLREHGPLSLPVAGRLLADVASALGFAHAHGVVHRDVKPSNILLAADGGAMLSDFGIARRQDFAPLTAYGLVIGTMDYMSPEQRSGGPVDGRSDQYALGVTAFEILAGRLPFVGSVPEIHRQHLVEQAPSVREFRPEVPRPVARAIARMLSKDPAERYPSLADPARVFEHLVFDRRMALSAIGTLSGSTHHGARAREILALLDARTQPMAVEGGPAGAAVAATVRAGAPNEEGTPAERAARPLPPTKRLVPSMPHGSRTVRARWRRAIGGGVALALVLTALYFFLKWP